LNEVEDPSGDEAFRRSGPKELRSSHQGRLLDGKQRAGRGDANASTQTTDWLRDIEHGGAKDERSLREHQLVDASR
jgi:hypothetical protein